MWNKKYKRQKKYYYAHKKEIIERKKGKYKEQQKKYQKQYFQKNKERITNSRKEHYRKTHLPKYCKNWEEWEQKRHILGKKRKAIRQAKYIHKKRSSVGYFTSKEWQDLKEKYNFHCAICGEKEPFENQHFNDLTIDHIIPLSKNGTNFIKNIQPLCHKCNCLKKDKIMKQG